MYFPDNIELAVARSGQTSDPSAGRMEFAAKFGSDASFKYGYLTKQSAAWAMLGVNFGNKFQPSSLAQDTDSMYVVSGAAPFGAASDAADKEGQQGSWAPCQPTNPPTHRGPLRGCFGCCQKGQQG